MNLKKIDYEGILSKLEKETKEIKQNEIELNKKFYSEYVETQKQIKAKQLKLKALSKECKKYSLFSLLHRIKNTILFIFCYLLKHISLAFIIPFQMNSNKQGGRS